MLAQDKPAFTPSHDDRAFIAEISARFPDRNIAQNFDEYLNTDPIYRVKNATFATNFVQRMGWKRVGIPGRAQSLQNHLATLDEMIAMTPAGVDREKIRLMLAIHDLGEAIVSDFTPHDKITRTEKKRLERLAINIIFENEPKKIALWEEFEIGETPEARLAKDFDLLETLFEAEIMAAKFPERAGNLHEFWDGMEKALQTDTGRKILKHLLSTNDQAGTMHKSVRIMQTARYLNGPR